MTYQIDISIREIQLRRKRPKGLDLNIRHLNLNNPHQLVDSQIPLTQIILLGHQIVRQLDNLIMKPHVRVPDHSSRLRHPGRVFHLLVVIHLVVLLHPLELFAVGRLVSPVSMFVAELVLVAVMMVMVVVMMVVVLGVVLGVFGRVFGLREGYEVFFLGALLSLTFLHPSNSVFHFWCF